MLDVTRVSAKPVYDMASDLPLILYDCSFEDVHFLVDPHEQQKVSNHLVKLWHDRQVVAKMTESLMLDVVGAQYAYERDAATDRPTDKIVRSVPSTSYSLTVSTTKVYVPLLQRARERAFPTSTPATETSEMDE